MAELLGMTPRPHRLVRRPLGFAGSVGAIVLFCVSLTPSLLPRHWAVQGVVSGITTAIGYGLGAAAGAAVRACWPTHPRLSRWAWWVLGGISAAAALLSGWLGASWQREVRELVGVQPATAWNPLFIAAVAAAVFAVLLVISRALRLGTRRLATTLGRFSPRPVASVAAVGLVAALTYGMGQQVVFTGFVGLAEQAAAQANATTAAGVSRPDSPYVSGSPASLVAWDTLGRQGRTFVAGTVPVPELAEFAGRAAVPPIRVYAGRESAEPVAQRAALAVRELDRTGAWRRSVLAVVVTTGTGWVNPAVPAGLEYLHAGDTAVVAMQYSHLPSWISFLADRSAAVEAATVLVGAVQERLAGMPAGQRPKLVVYGESLGSYGAEMAFGDLDALLSSVDGALLAGPPHANPIWQQVTAQRELASPIWSAAQPEGPVVSFAGDRTEPSAAERRQAKLFYLQHATDPVSLWTPELIYRKPAWLDGERGPEVSGAMRWFPVVTFWQVTMDLMTSTKVPDGHGHSYYAGVADGLAALVAPSGWTGADTAKLRPLLAALSH